jgi:hypothetical protein
MLTLFAVVGADAGHRAAAQGRLEAEYTVSISGIPIGRGNWIIDIASDQYTAAASGTTTGLIKFFTGAHGTGAAHGTMAAGQPMPTSYGETIVYDHRVDDVRMALTGGNVTDYAVEPPLPPAPDRVPVTDADRRGVFDPMTSMLNRVARATGLQSHGSGVRRPGALRFAQRISAHGNCQSGPWLCRARSGLRGVFHAGLRICP